MIIIGLTGSIGMGKSFIAKELEKLAIPVFDADKTVHELLENSEKAIDAVSTHFPSAVKKGKLDRKKIRTEIQKDPALLEKLEAILHPLVKQKQEQFLRKARYAGKHYVVLEVPLLFEAGWDHFCDVTIVVSAPHFIQERRVLARKHMTKEAFDFIVQQQQSSWLKRKKADFIIHTGLDKCFAIKQLYAVLETIERNL